MRISPNRVLIYPQAAIQREATKGAQVLYSHDRA
jgi:hypothetical protein